MHRRRESVNLALMLSTGAHAKAPPVSEALVTSQEFQRQFSDRQCQHDQRGDVGGDF
jgi:hypothetical protein